MALPQRLAGVISEARGVVTSGKPSRLYALGIVIFAALVVCSRSPSGNPNAGFLVALAVAGIAYLAAVREFFHTCRYPRRVLVLCLALAVLWRIPLLLKPPASADDIRRYLWDGRLQRMGYDPYTAIPADPALADVHTAETRGINNPGVPTPYPAGAELFFRGVTAISESVFAFKAAFLACDLAIIPLILCWLRRTGQPEHWVLAYAWHPLIATEVAGSGHIDIVGVLLLLASVVALTGGWRKTAAVTFGLAVAVKFLPLVLVPLHWRRARIRDALLAAAVVAVMYLPFLRSGRTPLGSLGIVVRRFRFNDPLFAGVERLVNPYIAAGIALLAGLATATWLRCKRHGDAPDAWAWPMAASLAFSPLIYPWYLLWLVPFLRSAPSLPLVVWTLSILTTYFVWHLHALGRPWQIQTWITALEYGPVLLAAAFVLLRRATLSQTPRAEARSSPG
jgi:alpha-1,6-mannosyltransferase